jgi:DNA-binding LacI/PurR family transcriptional regulator
MEDVARVADVSHQSLSRVLNDFPHTLLATRDRVLTAIEEFGCRRNTTARTLVTRQSGTIGVLTAHMNHFGPASIMLGSNPILTQRDTACCSRGSPRSPRPRCGRP